MFNVPGSTRLRKISRSARISYTAYSDPYVRPFVRPSQSLIRYSSKTAEQNFMKLSGIVHYMVPYCTSYFKYLSA